jgi:hypothetical protein
MVGQTCASPNGFGASGSDAPPPPPNMTIQEQFMVTQTEVMRCWRWISVNLEYLLYIGFNYDLQPILEFVVYAGNLR